MCVSWIQDGVVDLALAARGDGQTGQSQTGSRRDIPAADRRRRQTRAPEQAAHCQKGTHDWHQFIIIIIIIIIITCANCQMNADDNDDDLYVN